MALLDTFVNVTINKIASSVVPGSFPTVIFVKDTTAEGVYNRDDTPSNASPAFISFVTAFEANGGNTIAVVAAENLATYETFSPIIVDFRSATTSAEKDLTGHIVLSSTLTDGAYTAMPMITCANAYVAGAVAAYYATMNFDNADVVKDIQFTQANRLTTGNSDNKLLYADTFAGATRILAKDGKDDATETESITNYVARLCLQHNLKIRLGNVIASKIRVDDTGVTAVKNALAAELDRFVNNGYISPSKVWLESDYYIGSDLVAEKNTPLVNGYAIYNGSITQNHISQHKLPDFVVLYGDQTGVRSITVTGTVF